MAVIEVNLDNFEQEVKQADVPVLVDCWAPWCGPCKMLSPIVDAIAEEAEGFKVCKINVDDEDILGERLEVASIPTLLVFKNGEEAGRSVGVKGKDEILAMLKENPEPDLSVPVTTETRRIHHDRYYHCRCRNSRHVGGNLRTSRGKIGAGF